MDRDNGQTPSIETSGLTKRFGRVVALDRVDLAAPRTAIGLLGPNGAGKSTLLRVLLGLTRADSGAAAVLGLDVVAQGQRAAPSRRLHARVRRAAARRHGRRLRFPHGRDERAAPPRRAAAGGRRPLPRRAGRGALPADRWLFDRHEAARQAGAGYRPRPATRVPRRADEWPRPPGPRRDARSDLAHLSPTRHSGRPFLAHPGRRRAGLCLRGRPRRRSRGCLAAAARPG